ncbi:MAG: class I SAM-dependent methyltransferase [Anaerolineae bacterium]|nr:class I SAM-dependent methyltransferase [Anaerolineae bacterium]
MSTLKRLIKPLIPPALRPRLAALLSSDTRQTLPHTKFPLDAATRQAIRQSLANSQAAPQPRDISVIDFPEITDFSGYWGIFRGITNVLAPVNSPRDKYYRWDYYGQLIAQGQLDIAKDLFAVWHAVHKRPRYILEIGCRTGKSIATQLFAHPDPDSCTVFLIDPFIEMGSPQLIKNNLAHLGIPTQNVHVFVGYSETAFPALMAEFPDVRFDYLLVDGSHRKEDALKDLKMVTPYAREGGYIVFDDLGGNYQLIDVWEAWKANCAQDAGFTFREYRVPADFAVARKSK